MKGKAFKIFLKIEFIFTLTEKKNEEFEIRKNIRVLNIIKKKKKNRIKKFRDFHIRDNTDLSFL